MVNLESLSALAHIDVDSDDEISELHQSLMDLANADPVALAEAARGLLTSSMRSERVVGVLALGRAGETLDIEEVSELERVVWSAIVREVDTVAGKRMSNALPFLWHRHDDMLQELAASTSECAAVRMAAAASLHLGFDADEPAVAEALSRLAADPDPDVAWWASR